MVLMDIRMPQSFPDQTFGASTGSLFVSVNAPAMNGDCCRFCLVAAGASVRSPSLPHNRC